MAKKKSSASKKQDDGDEISFEQALAEARQIVQRLESGDTPLAESLQDYERGINRLKVCQEILQSAETKISLLAGFDADGNPVTEPMPAIDGDDTVAGRRSATGGTAKRTRGGKSAGNKPAGDDSPDRRSGDLDDASGLF